MLFTAVPPVMAPQTTGHPAALPQDVARVAPETRVSAPKEGGATDNTRSDLHRWRERPGRPAQDDGQKSAPPTLLQIKINSMLEEQQEARAQERREEDPAEAATRTQGVDEASGDRPDTAAQPADRAPAPTPQTGYYAEPEIENPGESEVSLSA